MTGFRHRKVAIMVAIMSLIAATRLTSVVGEIRAVDFLAILALGMCCGVMLCVIVSHVKHRASDESSPRES